MFNFFKENKNILFNDIIFINDSFKKFKIKDYFLLTSLLPIIWFFTWFYLMSFLFNFFFYLIFFLWIYFNKYFLKKKTFKKLYYKLNPSKNKNEFFVFLKIIFINIPKQYGFFYLYIFLKSIKNYKNKNHVNFKISVNLAIIMLIKFFIRFIFMLVFSYSLFIIKIAVFSIKCFNECINENHKSLYSLFYYFMFDFSSHYLSKSYILVKKKRIKFFKKQIIFNPPKFDITETLKMVKHKIKIEPDTILGLAESLDTIENNSKIRYVRLKSEFDLEKKDSELYAEYNNKKFLFEKKPHTTSMFAVNEDTMWMNRGTTKSVVKVKDIYLNSEEMKTHTPWRGTINMNKTEFKTNVIESKNKDIEIEPHTILIRNVHNNPEFKEVFKQSFVNSLGNPLYFWDKGELYKDPNYINLVDKILNDPILNTNNGITNALNIIAQVYKDHLEELKFTVNDQIFNSIIKILIGNRELIDQTTLSILLKFIDEN